MITGIRSLLYIRKQNKIILYQRGKRSSQNKSSWNSNRHLPGEKKGEKIANSPLWQRRSKKIPLSKQARVALVNICGEGNRDFWPTTIATIKFATRFAKLDNAVPFLGYSFSIVYFPLSLWLSPEKSILPEIAKCVFGQFITRWSLAEDFDQTEATQWEQTRNILWVDQSFMAPKAPLWDDEVWRKQKSLAHTVCQSISELDRNHFCHR